HEAYAKYEAALADDPRHGQALLNVGLLCLHMSRPDTAAEYLRRATDVVPADPVGHNSLGNALRELGDLEGAARAYRAAMKADPSHLNAALNYGASLQQLGDPQRAVRVFERLVGDHANRVSPADATHMWVAYGGALLDAGRAQEALVAHAEALKLSPCEVAAWNELGLAQADLGLFEQAEASYVRALECDPGFAKAYLNLSKARRFTDADAPLTEKIEALVMRADMDDSAKSELHFALGKIRDDQGAYAAAFEHYQAGNLLYPSADYDSAAELAQADEICEVISADWMRSVAAIGNASSRPFFVLGMPRSGTSLVEQIAASHPQVFGAGELTDIDRAVKSIVGPGGYPAGLNGAAPETFSRAASGYLDALDRHDTAHAHITDKMPGNFRYVGLIAALFPKARIVYCRRHPLDVCLSIYFRHFVGGHAYAYDLRALATEYVIHERLMDHWCALLPDRVLRLDYEALVADQQTQSRQLIQFLQLPWDDACLSFYETKRAVHTASNWQVRRPIYDGSAGRWRHYEPHLGPLIDALSSYGVRLPGLESASLSNL
ncbi:MAG: sulfotransferase, partial [Gammaproteobacteria bacterium]|nr:sulfotransferase [Gammaproteobacteria bacterium]